MDKEKNISTKGKSFSLLVLVDNKHEQGRAMCCSSCEDSERICKMSDNATINVIIYNVGKKRTLVYLGILSE